MDLLVGKAKFQKLLHDEQVFLNSFISYGQIWIETAS